ncbi:MAG: hypothetical protein EOO75_15110, partial [Myxococcales bacterium]
MSGLTVLTLSACKGQDPLVPTGPTIDEVSPERTRVTMTKKVSSPMVVDWQPENRADLEVNTRRGPSFVRFDQDHFELIDDCRSEGGYNYIGVSPKGQESFIRSEGELAANLPLGTFKAMLRQHRSFRISLVVVGKRILDRSSLAREGMVGDGCKLATHVVRSLTVGAFKMSSGAERAASAGGRVNGIGAEGSMEGESGNLQHDGDFSACDKADPDAALPPSCCRLPDSPSIDPSAPMPLTR